MPKDDDIQALADYIKREIDKPVQRKVSDAEMEHVDMFVQLSYPDQSIVKVVAENWKEPPRKEGGGLQKAGLSLLKSTGDVSLFHKLSTGEYACYMDTIAGPQFNSWILIVTVYTN